MPFVIAARRNGFLPFRSSAGMSLAGLEAEKITFPISDPYAATAIEVWALKIWKSLWQDLRFDQFTCPFTFLEKLPTFTESFVRLT